MSTCEQCGSPSEVIDDGREVVTHYLGCAGATPQAHSLRGLRTIEECEQSGCDNPRYSDHPRVKFCADHKDPKNRKE